MRGWGRPCPDRRGYHHGNLKEALVEAARRFIAERGLAGFTLVEAARLVGVTPAALYRHFRGREALVAEVAGRGYADLGQRLARALGRPGTPLERFTRLGETYLAFAEQEPGYYQAMFSGIAGEAGGLPVPGAFDLLLETVEATIPEGLSIDPRFAVLEVWALAHGVAMLSLAGHLPRGPGLPDRYELLRAGIVAVVHGAARPRAEA